MLGLDGFSRRLLRSLHALVEKGSLNMTNKPYNTHYYCAQCSRWIPKTEAKQARCPKCGKTLRTRPRRYGKKRFKTSTFGCNATSFQTLHQASGIPPKPTGPHVAEPIIKPSKQQRAEKPCNNNVRSLRNMGVWKK